MTYKGYYISSTIIGETFITKGGHFISYAANVDEAQRIIDELTA